MPTTLRNTDILFNDATTQSTAYVTTYGSIGTYVIAWYLLTANATLAVGSTVAGSTLFRGNSAASSFRGVSLNSYTDQNTDSLLYGQSLYAVTALSLSGTWRNMTFIANRDPALSQYLLGLFVRVS